MDYKETLNLPQTEFGMKANLAQKEPQILKFWEEIGLYKKTLAKNKGNQSYILHDGPPYANGDIHVGHTFNKVLKDLIVKYQSMNGKYAPYVPGWDCHGQPIEHNVEKSLKGDKKLADRNEVRKLSREYALRFVNRQRDEFKRLGVMGDWENPYLTLNHSYEASIVRVFGALYEKGLIYKGRKPIHWCYRCKTALAEAEIEYENEKSPSIYIKFPIVDGQKLAHLEDVSLAMTNLLVWTTTPWTLPANVAVAVDPNAKYVIAESDGENFIFIKDLLDDLSSRFGRKFEVKKEFRGEE
jgi:isoleucyl-tRNA synthetase